MPLNDEQKRQQFGEGDCEICGKHFLCSRPGQKACNTEHGHILSARNRHGKNQTQHRTHSGRRKQVRQYNFKLLTAALRFWAVKNPSLCPAIKFNY